jgi:hypothetical protein
VRLLRALSSHKIDCLNEDRIGCVYYTARSNTLCKNRAACLSSKPSKSSRISPLSLSTARYETYNLNKDQTGLARDSYSHQADTFPCRLQAQCTPRRNALQSLAISIPMSPGTACVRKHFKYRQLPQNTLQDTNKKRCMRATNRLGQTHLPPHSTRIPRPRGAQMSERDETYYHNDDADIVYTFHRAVQKVARARFLSSLSSIRSCLAKVFLADKHTHTLSCSTTRRL